MEIKNPAILHRISGEKKAAEITNKIFHNKYFTSTISSADASPPYVGLYFISFNIGKIGMLALGVRRRNTATASAQIKFLYIVQIEDFEIDHILDKPEYSYVTRHTEAVINKEKTGHIIKEIIEQNPNSKDEIEKIINLINGDTELEETLHNIKLSYQRDAVGLSAEIFGGQNMRNVILQHMPIYEFETIDSIIDVIDEDEEDTGWQYVQESHLIENDLEQFDGYKYIRKYGHKQKILQKHDKFLVVTTTDKDTLESNIGVDLIYANINSGSFVFVQYKKMDQHNGKYIFYPNTQFHEERKRMSKFNNDLNKIKSENNYDNFRLSSSPLFFKFCKNLQLKTMNPQTIQGIYIPLDMWMKYEKTGPKTKAGKTVVQEGMPDKALTTSMFVDMVSRDLIGTKREAFAALSTYIEKCLDNKKSLVLSLEIDKS